MFVKICSIAKSLKINYTCTKHLLFECNFEVNYLLEFLLDTTNLQVDYTLYVSILFGLSVKLLWMRNIEFNFIDSIYSSSDVHLQGKNLLLQKEKHVPINKQLLSILKYIRRKKNLSEEPDSTISSAAF